MTTISITKLRKFYESLPKLSSPTEEQLSILEDYNRGNNYTKLIDLYKESKKDFSGYKNIDEPFLPLNLSHRRKFLNKVGVISKTRHVTLVFEERKNKIDVDDANYNFEYIQREVPTSRTPKTKSEAGIKESGAGGIDFIGSNYKKHLPILGEIKVGGDQNSFYALIQLLTYLSELSTHNQIERINNKTNPNPFGNISQFSSKNSFYLYIVLVFSEYGKLKQQILTETQKLAAHLEQDIQEIEKIVFLKMYPDDKEKEITKI